MITVWHYIYFIIVYWVGTRRKIEIVIVLTIYIIYP